MSRCHRCGDRFELARVGQVHCERCSAEVARLIAADARRHAPRWPIAKETTWA